MVVVTFSPGLEQLHVSDFVLPFILYKMKTASEWIVVWITYSIYEVSIQYQVSMKSAVDTTAVWEPMSKGTDVKMQVGSESVLRNGRKEGMREEKWMRLSAENSLQERLSMEHDHWCLRLHVLDSYPQT